MLGNHNKQFKGNSFILVDWATSTPWKALHSWMKQMFHTIAFKSILFVAVSQEKEVFAGTVSYLEQHMVEFNFLPGTYSMICQI